MDDETSSDSEGHNKSPVTRSKREGKIIDIDTRSQKDEQKNNFATRPKIERRIKNNETMSKNEGQIQDHEIRKSEGHTTRFKSKAHMIVKERGTRSRKDGQTKEHGTRSKKEGRKKDTETGCQRQGNSDHDSIPHDEGQMEVSATRSQSKRGMAVCEMKEQQIPETSQQSKREKGVREIRPQREEQIPETSHQNTREMRVRGNRSYREEQTPENSPQSKREKRVRENKSYRKEQTPEKSPQSQRKMRARGIIRPQREEEIPGTSKQSKREMRGVRESRPPPHREEPQAAWRQQLKAKVTGRLASRGASTTSTWTTKPKTELSDVEMDRLNRQRANKRRWAQKERERAKTEMESLREDNARLELRRQRLLKTINKLRKVDKVCTSFLKNHPCRKTREVVYIPAASTDPGVGNSQEIPVLVGKDGILHYVNTSGPSTQPRLTRIRDEGDGPSARSSSSSKRIPETNRVVREGKVYAVMQNLDSVSQGIALTPLKPSSPAAARCSVSADQSTSVSPAGRSSDPYVWKTSPAGRSSDPYAWKTSPAGRSSDPYAWKTSPAGRSSDPYAWKNSPASRSCDPEWPTDQEKGSYMKLLQGDTAGDDLLTDVSASPPQALMEGDELEGNSSASAVSPQAFTTDDGISSLEEQRGSPAASPQSIHRPQSIHSPLPSNAVSRDTFTQRSVIDNQSVAKRKRIENPSLSHESGQALRTSPLDPWAVSVFRTNPLSSDDLVESAIAAAGLSTSRPLNPDVVERPKQHHSSAVHA